MYENCVSNESIPQAVYMNLLRITAISKTRTTTVINRENMQLCEESLESKILSISYEATTTNRVI